MILEVDNISFSYGNHRIFENVSFSLDKGDILSILGPNGAGKSTLLNCISGLVNYATGDIKLRGRSIKDMDFKERAKRIGYVQQIHIPTYDHTVREYITMGRSPHLGIFERPKEHDYKIVDKTIKIMGLKKISNKSYIEISGGERQQASIARVIVQEPDIIILDEPTSHLDYGNQIKTLKMIKELSKQGFIIINTSHNPDQVTLLENQVGILNKGHFKFGKSKDLINEESLKDLYKIGISMFYSSYLDRNICCMDKI